MGFDVLILSGSIFGFVVALCFLLHRIQILRNREQILADRIARRHERNSTASDSFVNTTYVETESGVFPGAPPPYSHVDSPPKYEDIIKSEVAVTIDRPSVGVRESPPNDRSVPLSVPPPPYTISV